MRENGWPERRLHRGMLRAGSSAMVSLLFVLALLVGMLGSVFALGDSLGLRLHPEFMSNSRLDHQAALGFALLGLVVFAATTAIVHLRNRGRWQRQEREYKAAISSLLTAKDRADLILASEPQVIVTWNGAEDEPEIMGDPRVVLDIPVPRRVLGFGSWLPSESARMLEGALEELKRRGHAFSYVLKSNDDRFIAADGSAVAGRAVMRLRDLSGDRARCARAEENYETLAAETSALKCLLDAIPQPIWLRDGHDQLSFVNQAYVRAVDAPTAEAAIEKGLDLLDEKHRVAARAARAQGKAFMRRLPAIVSGQKHVFDVVDVVSGPGGGGIASDVTELEAARADLAMQIDSHVRTLHQLPTAVAIFDRAKRLQFHNEAYRTLWQLDAAFLAAMPSDGEILDQLRAERRLPEQADFRGWKRTHLEGYQTLDTLEHWWYLPDGRTLRVVTNPNPQGGVTYLFDDVTERFHLESRFNALSRVQGETLDSLKEAVAVFGSDGRLKLSNPAFAEIWGLPAAALADTPHIDAIIDACGEPSSHGRVWAEIRGAVTGLHDRRQPLQLRMEHSDRTVDAATSPLPDGATLATFADVTASVHAERMLKERNEALENASQIKNSFVHTVSYELRTPLQSITGFTEALLEGAAGALNDRQQEYLAHVMSSSEGLKALVEDILDLANIDTGTIELDLAPVNVPASIEAAVAGLRDRIAESGIKLQVNVAPNAPTLLADAKRMRQIVFNLLKNAVAFSERGQSVTVEAFPSGRELIVRVSDQGRGIPPEIIDKVFDRFEAHAAGSRQKSVGLGLAIVRSFVELHGGSVTLSSQPGRGTVATCRFPIVGETRDAQAA